MTTLDSQAFDRARDFLRTRARPLERALYLFRFEEQDADVVLQCLHPYQNVDGGFGHALEPDVRTPNSSALAPALALRILHELKVSPEHPMIQAAIGYLAATHDTTSRVWRVVPADANDHPHVPWWHDDGTSLSRAFDGFRIIPRALIIAMLHRFRSAVPPDLLRAVTEDTLAAIEALPVLGEGGGSDLEYVQTLANIVDLPHRDRLLARVRRAVTDTVVRDPEQWATYCITPLRAAPSPDTIGAERIRDLVETHLALAVEAQSAEGTWDPSWSWFGQYPDAWEVARREWQGILTLEMLTSLRAYGRV